MRQPHLAIAHELEEDHSLPDLRPQPLDRLRLLINVIEFIDIDAHHLEFPAALKKFENVALNRLEIPGHTDLRHRDRRKIGFSDAYSAREWA